MAGTLIAKFTGGVNAPLDSATFFPKGIDVSPFDAVMITVDLITGGANAAFNYYVYGKDEAGNGVHSGQNQIPINMWHAAMGWGPACSYSYNGMNGIAAALPQRIAIAFDAAGAGVALTVRVWGQRVGR